jgi:hypothetical protein
MKYREAIFIPVLVALLLSGCLGKNVRPAGMNDQINVFGVELYSAIDYREINGVVASEEPCLRGYDRSFDALDITIGYGFNKKIRKITTRNSGTSLFGIHPGAPFGEGKQKILQAGFQVDVPPFRFRRDSYSVTFLVDGNDTIFGLTLEALD